MSRRIRRMQLGLFEGGEDLPLFTGLDAAGPLDTEPKPSDLARDPVGAGRSAKTRTFPHRSEYDGLYYRDRIDATRRMIEVETGEPMSRVGAEVWLDRDDDARISAGEFGR